MRWESGGPDPVAEAITSEYESLGPVVEMISELEGLRQSRLGLDEMVAHMAARYPEAPGGGPWDRRTITRVLDVVDSIRHEEEEAAPGAWAASASPTGSASPADTAADVVAPPARPARPNDRIELRDRRRMLTLGAAGLAAAALAASAGAGLYFLADGGQDVALDQVQGATTTLNPADTLAIRIDPAAPDADDAANASPTDETTDGNATDSDTTDDAAASESTADLVPASATIKNDGKLYFEGAFADQETADAALLRATEVFGEDNIVADYVIDPAAPTAEVSTVSLDKPVLFESGTADIDPEYIPFLEACGDVLELNPSIVMSVTGFADATGPEDLNLDLSQQRAEAIVAFYRELDIGDDQLDGSGMGEQAPFADNTTEEGRRQNRRAMLQLLNVMSEVDDG